MSDQNSQEVRLRQLHVHLHEGCDLACRHCSAVPYQYNSAVASQFIDLSHATKAIYEAIPLGLQSVRINGFGSLTFPDLDPLLDLLEKFELSIDLETNGIGLSSQRLERLARLPQCQVHIGLDGTDPETHDQNNKLGSYKNAINAIRLIANLNIPVQAIFTVRRHNIHQIADVVRLVEDLGGSSIRISLLSPTNGSGFLAKKNGNGHHPLKSYSSSINTTSHSDDLQVEELIALGWRIERELSFTTSIRLKFEQPPAFRGLHPKARVDVQDFCRIFDSLSVTKNGEYTFCGLSRGISGLVLGIIGINPLADIWKHHPSILLLREGLPDRLEGICERCTLKQTCLGSCPIENYLRTGSFWSPGWYCEAAERVGLFPAGRLIENFWSNFTEE